MRTLRRPYKDLKKALMRPYKDLKKALRRSLSGHCKVVVVAGCRLLAISGRLVVCSW